MGNSEVPDKWTYMVRSVQRRRMEVAGKEEVKADAGKREKDLSKPLETKVASEVRDIGGETIAKDIGGAKRSQGRR